jgi:cytochrome b
MSEQKILVWDWPVRLGHVLLIAGFALAWLTAESEDWRLVHVLAGGCVVGVCSFRLLWGVLGSRTARFADFVRGPQAVVAYLRSLLSARPAHHLGHNPAGGWAIVLMLGLGLASGLAGWALYNDLGGEWLEEVHEALASAMLGVVFIHVAGVLISSWLHDENLPRAMVDGKKAGPAESALPSSRPVATVLMLAWVAA